MAVHPQEAWSLALQLNLVMIGIASVSTLSVTKSNGNWNNGYIELSKGIGISDDAAVITSALMRGDDCSRGVLLGDGIDTFDKYSTKIYRDGQDEIIGKNSRIIYEKEVDKNFPVSDEDIMTFIFISAIDENSRRSFPSCSQRRFWQRVRTDKGEKQFDAVKSHETFVNYLKDESARYPVTQRIGFRGIKNTNFYEKYIEKLKLSIELEMIKDKYGICGGERISYNELQKYIIPVKNGNGNGL